MRLLTWLFFMGAFSVQAKDLPLEKVHVAPIHAKVLNEIHGNLTREWRLRSFATTRHYCVFKFNE